jgi:hypothetical protein
MIRSVKELDVFRFLAATTYIWDSLSQAVVAM